MAWWSSTQQRPPVKAMRRRPAVSKEDATADGLEARSEEATFSWKMVLSDGAAVLALHLDLKAW